MSKKRLSGNKIKIPNAQLLDKVYVYTMASMDEAHQKYNSAFTFRPMRSRNDNPYYSAIGKRMMSGDARLEKILARADEFISEAIEVDSRLVKKSGWVRGEDGIDCCPAMFQMGDDRPFLDRRRIGLAEAATLESVRVVVSTDTKNIQADNAAAFIAAAKLAQQFRPLELWWQSAWLIDSPAYGIVGHVVLTPMVKGELDFSRLQFVLSDEDRDRCGYYIMFAHAYPNGYRWGQRVGEWSYLDNTFDFIRESGIKPCAKTVARYAAKWAGMEPSYMEEVYGWEASQYWEPTSEKKSWEPTSADRRRWAEDKRRREQERRRQEKERAIV